MTDATRERIEALLADHKIMLFMKGSPQAPMCGFSATAVGILDGMGEPYGSFNVLEDPDIREGIKIFGNWPTIPQLYVDGELLGGSDIISEMLNSGELHQVLGLQAPDRTPPDIDITPAAVAAIAEGMLGAEPGQVLNLAVGANWQPQFWLDAAPPDGIVATVGELEIHMDVMTAGRARGVSIDFVDALEGSGLVIDNPNAPPVVKRIAPAQLKQMLDAGQSLTLVDVRPEPQRQQVAFPDAVGLDKATLPQLEAEPTNTAMVFICHHGKSSLSAAEHFRLKGFTDVYSLEGGIDAWAQTVDPEMPRY